jgi:ArsR family transcriptional regulator
LRTSSAPPKTKRRSSGAAPVVVSKPIEVIPDESDLFPADATPLKVSDSVVKRLTEVFRMLADMSRLKILLALAQDGHLHVSALCELLDQSQPAVSHHLTLRRMARLVDYDRVGKHNYYRLSSEGAGELFEEFFAEAGGHRRELTLGEFVLAYERR